MTFAPPPTTVDPNKPIDVDAFVTQLSNALGFLKTSGGKTDPSGITPTGDVISNTAASQTAAQNTASGQLGEGPSGSVSPLTGGLGLHSYDDFQVSQEYGNNGHPGVDIAVPVGTKLIAPVSGKITHAGNDDPSGYGAWVEITAPDGTVIRYGHLSGISVKVGQDVTAGQLLGASGGQSGAAGAGNSSGPHLHFEVHQGSGPAVDPAPYLAGGWQILGGDPGTPAQVASATVPSGPSNEDVARAMAEGRAI